MGIISDFQELNREIEELDKNSSVLKIFTKIKCRIQKKKLTKIAEKLKTANVPLEKNDILELASSIYINCIPDGIFENIKVNYYPRSNDYRIFVDINKVFDDTNYRLNSAVIEVSNQDFGIHVAVSVEDMKNNVVKSTSITCKNLSTNIREIKNDVQYVNSVLLNTMSSYIEEIIK